MLAPRDSYNALMAAAVVTNRRDDSLKPDILEGARKELLAHCVRLTRGHDDAFDLEQEAMVKGFAQLFVKGTTIKGDGPPIGYLKKIATNEFLIRKRRKTTGNVESLNVPKSESDSTERIETLPARKDADPAIAFMNAMKSDQLARAVGRLPDHHRELIELYHFNDMDYVEIADHTKIPLGTVKSRLNRAREALRRILATSGVNGPEDL